MGIASTIKRLPFFPTPIDQFTVLGGSFQIFVGRRGIFGRFL